MKHYTVKNNFDIDGFLSSCRLIGVILAAETEGEQTHGFIELCGHILTVHLNNPALSVTVDAKVSEFNL